MLHILWLIIKLILILLGVILAIVLLTVLSLLFCPLGYQGEGKKENDLLCAQGKISWLFGAIAFQAGYDQERGIYHSVKILGIEASSYRRWLKKIRRKKKPHFDQAEKILENEEQSDSSQENRIESSKNTQTKRQESSKTEQKNSRKKDRPRILGMIRKIADIPGKIYRIFSNLRCTMKKFCDKIRQTKNFFQNEKIKAVIRLLLEQTKHLLVHISPKKIRGQICFGTGDPASTGQILGVLGAAYSLYGDSVVIVPDFENSIFEGCLFIKGRIYGYFLLLTGWRLYRNPDLKAMIQKMRKAK